MLVIIMQHTYSVMNSFLNTYGWTHWVVASYEDWIMGPHSPIRRTFAELPPAKTKDGRVVTLHDMSVEPSKPDITPDSCRTNRGTYTNEIWCEVRVDGVPRHARMCVAKFPRMVVSEHEAGYFVVEGTERVFINRESMRYEVPRFRPPSKSKSPHVWSVDVTSLDAPFSLSFNVKTKELKAHIGFESNCVVMDAWTLWRCMGDASMPESKTSVDVQDAMRESAEKHAPEEEEDLLYVVGRLMLKSRTAGVSKKRTRAYATESIELGVLPFLRDTKEKQEFLGRTMRELIEFALGKREATDLDAMENKRVDTAGKFVARLVARELREAWNKTIKTLAGKPYEKDVEKFFEVEYVEKNVTKGMKTSADPDEKSASVLPRKASWQEALSAIRRVNADVGASSFVPGPRMLHGTWYGFYCACETPEGPRTGLTRETALFFKCSLHGDPKSWRRWIEEAVARGGLGGEGRVLVNQSVCVSGVDVTKMLAVCRDLKRQNDPHASVCVPCPGEIRIDVSEGRAMRPVWVPGAQVDLEFRGDFGELIRQNRVEWVDAAQCRTILISTTEQIEGQYMELHPTSLFGPSAANIPFADHNPGSRNLFGSHVRHQAMGHAHPFASRLKPHFETHDRFDSDETHHMWYPQRALCDTEVARKMQSHVYPNGWNAVIFILAKPWGQEDSMGIARRHVDFGAGVVYTELSIEINLTSDEERFGVLLPNRHRKVDVDGLPHVGQTIFPDDVFACKVLGKSETPVRWRKKFPARVRAVCLTKTRSVLIRVSWRRTPEIGDKLASRHGQKGVINFEILDDATYWTSSGITPDIIMNPAALPSRMTIGHMLEMLCGKANALEPPPGFTKTGCGGTVTDCTPYSETYDYEAVQSILRSRGFQPRGHEVVYNGTTGEVMRDCHVFVGPAFIQRLIHFSFTKCYARGRGVKNPQTGQPPKGRRNDGGLRLGEGETKAMQAHGAASSMQAAFLGCSDGIEVFICSECHEVGCASVCVQCGAYPCAPRTVPRSFMLLRDQLRVVRVNAELA